MLYCSKYQWLPDIDNCLHNGNIIHVDIDYGITYGSDDKNGVGVIRTVKLIRCEQTGGCQQEMTHNWFCMSNICIRHMSPSLHFI